MAYTKYSLTPANNNATPPDGAPEGMLPSAVNDTMRDMMAQIRDCGDGIRDGTYTMTAPKITGGTITGAAFTGNTFTSPVISGGSINNTPIGGTTANSGAFTTLSASGATTFSGATVVSGSLTANTFSSSGATITGGSINSTAIGGSTAAAGAFTTLSASGVATISAGTVSAPAITTTGDTNTGIFFPAADTIAFTEGGVEAMRITSAGNVGIGTSTPVAPANTTALTIYNASESRIALQNSTSGTLESDGASLAINGSDFYITNREAGALFFFNNGSERMRITSDGDLCIGRTSRINGERLSIARSSTVTTDPFASGEITFALQNTSNTAGNSTSIENFDSGGRGNSYIRFINVDQNYAGAIAFGTATTGASNFGERMRIDSSGNVGIAVSSPLTKLHMAGGTDDANVQDYITLSRTGYTGSNFRQVIASSSGSVASQNTIVFKTSDGTNAPTERVRIDGSGNVGIGTSSPAERLDVQGTGDIKARIYTTGATLGTHAGLYLKTGSYEYIIQNFTTTAGSAGALRFYDITANTERMRITSGGYFKASNTGTYQNSTGAFHEFYSNGQTTEVLFIKSDNASYTGDALFVDVNRNTTNNSFYAINYYNRAANAYKFRVADSGNVTNTNGSYGTISDIKNKENIVDATPKLDKIKQLQVRNFNFKGDDLKQIGFIAQEFEQVFPSMVEEHHDKDADGNDLGTTTKSIKTSVLVPILVKAIQEQQAMIEELKQEVAALKTK